MKTKQPAWRFAANLGDVNPFYSGRLLYVDATGVYDPELVIFEETPDGKPISVSRVCVPRCTMLANDPVTLSDNHFHADKPAWFASELASAADHLGRTAEDLARDLCSSDPVARAVAFAGLVCYFGVFEFDQYPVQMMRAVMRRKYRAAFKR